MRPIDLIRVRKEHVRRLANQGGAAGESGALSINENWLPRPRGRQLQFLLSVLRDSGVVIKPSSFDAIQLPNDRILDFSDEAAVRTALPDMVFVEIKTSNQPRVTTDFSGFFFALTEAEISAAEALGDQHRVALYNKRTGSIMMTSVQSILARAKSTNWQLSVQL